MFRRRTILPRSCRLQWIVLVLLIKRGCCMILYYLLAAVLIAIDQLVKWGIVQNFALYDELEVIPNIFPCTTSRTVGPPGGYCKGGWASSSSSPSWWWGIWSTPSITCRKGAFWPVSASPSSWRGLWATSLTACVSAMWWICSDSISLISRYSTWQMFSSPSEWVPWSSTSSFSKKKRALRPKGSRKKGAAKKEKEMNCRIAG